MNFEKKYVRVKQISLGVKYDCVSEENEKMLSHFELYF